jgi:2-phosphosulfolactate phosphatase
MHRLSQNDFDVCLEWGMNGLRHLSGDFEVAVIIDTLSFTTALDVALSRDAIVVPAALDFDNDLFRSRFPAAIFAEKRGKGSYSLSSATLENLPRRSILVLPSINGSTITLTSNARITIAASLRNAAAVGRWIAARQARVLVCPAGERWPDMELRPAFEDFLAAGAVIDATRQPRSPEAQAAVAVFRDFYAGSSNLMDCMTANELVSLGYGNDVEYASQLNISEIVPRLFSEDIPGYGLLKYYRDDARKSLSLPLGWSET